MNAKSLNAETALESARLHGNSPIVDLLVKAGAKGERPATAALTFRQKNTDRDAVMRALPLIQQADLNFTKKSGCVSCHNEALTDLAISTARRNGFHVDEQMAKAEVTSVTAFYGDWRERLLQGMAPGGLRAVLQWASTPSNIPRT